MEYPDVYILSAARTPIGSFLGSLSTVSAPHLASITIKESLKRAHIDGQSVDEIIMGCVLPAGVGQAPARQAMRYAQLPDKISALTINKVCGSGLKAVMLAAQSIKSGDASVVIAGGMENMSLSPHIMKNSRSGYKMGDATMTDSMIDDGLYDPYSHSHMGEIAEIAAKTYSISRERQDNYAIESYTRAKNAILNNYFKEEIIPVEIPQKKGNPIIVDTDEEPGRGIIEKIPTLKPAFQSDGTITAGNASSLNDGAASLILASAHFVEKNNLQPLAKITGYTTASIDPTWFTIAPGDAVQALLNKLGKQAQDIDLYEINEAFSVVALLAMDTLGLDHQKVNIHGGAVALGHPIGSSGARILTTLLYALKQQSLKTGIASLCIGGGEAVAVSVELV